ncbi:hypothetical protein UY3_12888, partial [Chelonia mydas]
LKQMKELEQEKDFLLQGLEMVERAWEWYHQQIQTVQERQKHLGKNKTTNDFFSEGNQSHLGHLLPKLQEVNRCLRELLSTSGKPLNSSSSALTRQVPAAPTPPPALAGPQQAISVLKEQNWLLTKDLHRVLSDLLDAMLGNLLAESPDTDRLHYILEHINYWIVSRVWQERGRAIRSSTALLRFTITLPEFDNSAEFPRMGHRGAQLALSTGDPSKDISWQARERVYRLYQLLLHQRGLTIHEAEDLWCWDWHQDSRLLGYRNTAQVFGKFFSEEQRRFFLWTAVLAIHDPLLRVSQARLVLAFSLLGEAQQLMGDKQEAITANVKRELHIIRHLRQVPEALQGLCL